MTESDWVVKLLAHFYARARLGRRFKLPCRRSALDFYPRRSSTTLVFCCEVKEGRKKESGMGWQCHWLGLLVSFMNSWMHG